jgi:hypothetical protein
MTETLTSTSSYFPPPESMGGWHNLSAPDEIRSHAGIDPRRLDQALEVHALLYGGES